MNKLKLSDIMFAYSEPAKWCIDCTFHGGHIYQLIGENGSGKSTVGRIITGIQLCDKGNAQLNGKSIREMTPNEKRDLFFYIPQEPLWSFIGGSFCKNLKYFSKENKICSNLIIDHKNNTFYDKLQAAVNKDVFDISSEDVFFLAILESWIWQRTVLFIDECPDLYDKDAITFFDGMLNKRVESELITIVARHILMEFSNAKTIVLDMSRFKV
uniref:ABC transporter n=1 Tax=Candidatus Kentrum sp. MB TaxID=2138164 RepID=A0A451BAA7_9GAMM|nr:MAG: ABC transporter [Candidatus Kentron sp. MB]VFK75203.1 MAG: ABC transporter [Candidatus Kentron sp. MB]